MYSILNKALVKANSQDLETWIRKCLGDHFHIVKRINNDETGKIFKLEFKHEVSFLMDNGENSWITWEEQN